MPGKEGPEWRLCSVPENFPEVLESSGPIARLTDTGQQLILPLSSGMLTQLLMLAEYSNTANPRYMPGPLLLIMLDGCVGLEGL